jgi:hypothetical protein
VAGYTVAWGMRLASGLRQLPATARVVACLMAQQRGRTMGTASTGNAQQFNQLSSKARDRDENSGDGHGRSGGYFGGRLAGAGNDVTFIARGAHRDAIVRDGLQIISPLGNLTVKPAKAVSDPARRASRIS